MNTLKALSELKETKTKLKELQSKIDNFKKLQLPSLKSGSRLSISQHSNTLIYGFCYGNIDLVKHLKTLGKDISVLKDWGEYLLEMHDFLIEKEKTEKEIETLQSKVKQLETELGLK